MDTLVRAGILYPVTSPPVENGWLLLRDGRITGIGGGAPPHADKVIDLTGHLVMPGFVNAHCHLQFTAARGSMPQGGFMEWVQAAIAYSSKIAVDEMLRGVEQGVAELLSSGTTAVGDIGGHPAVAGKVARSSLRAVLLVETIAPGVKDEEAAWRNCLGLLDLVKNAGGQVGLAPHGPHTVSPRYFSNLSRYARDQNIPITSHVAESPEEALFINKGEGPFRALLRQRGALAEGFNGYGKSPVMVIKEQGALKRLIAAHLNEVDEVDIAALIAAKTIPVFCPGSSRWFGRKKVMPFDRFIEAGLAPCLGTDSAASNDSLSMLEELRAARGYFPTIPAERWVESATINGARALGLECGALETGRWADIVSFPARGGSPLDALFAAKEASFVMVGGDIIRNIA